MAGVIVVIFSKWPLNMKSRVFDPNHNLNVHMVCIFVCLCDLHVLYDVCDCVRMHLQASPPPSCIAVLFTIETFSRTMLQLLESASSIVSSEGEKIHTCTTSYGQNFGTCVFENKNACMHVDKNHKSKVQNLHVPDKQM